MVRSDAKIRLMMVLGGGWGMYLGSVGGSAVNSVDFKMKPIGREMGRSFAYRNHAECALPAGGRGGFCPGATANRNPRSRLVSALPLVASPRGAEESRCAMGIPSL
jgi:hypothetical protein